MHSLRSVRLFLGSEVCAVYGHRKTLCGEQEDLDRISNLPLHYSTIAIANHTIL